MVQISPPYMTTGKVIALTIQTFVGKVMSLLLNTLSWFVIASLSRSMHLFNFVAAVHHAQWFWSPRKENLPFFPLFTYLFAMKWWGQMPWSQFFESPHLKILNWITSAKTPFPNKAARLGSENKNMDVSLRKSGGWGGTIQATPPVWRENELRKNAKQRTDPISVTVAGKVGQE